MIRKKSRLKTEAGDLCTYIETPDGGPTRILLEIPLGQCPLTARQARALAKRLQTLADLARG